MARRAGRATHIWGTSAPIRGYRLIRCPSATTCADLAYSFTCWSSSKDLPVSGVHGLGSQDPTRSRWPPRRGLVLAILLQDGWQPHGRPPWSSPARSITVHQAQNRWCMCAAGSIKAPGDVADARCRGRRRARGGRAHMAAVFWLWPARRADCRQTCALSRRCAVLAWKSRRASGALAGVGRAAKRPDIEKWWPIRAADHLSSSSEGGANSARKRCLPPSRGALTIAAVRGRRSDRRGWRGSWVSGCGPLASRSSVENEPPAPAAASARRVRFVRPPTATRWSMANMLLGGLYQLQFDLIGGWAP